MSDPRPAEERTGELRDRVALVTGAAQGIGRAVALALAAQGATVAACDLKDKAPDLLQELGDGASYHKCDVSDADAAEELVDAVVGQHGRLNILINNAGIARDGLILLFQPEEWRKVMAVNLDGAFNCTRAAARYLLRARKQGRVVNVSSVVGEAGSAGQVAYAASKAGVLGLTKSLAREFAPRGVTVNAVSPGYIQTPMTEAYEDTDRGDELLAAIPLGRVGTAEEVANAVSFLCSDGAGYITGQVLRINGGLYI